MIIARHTLDIDLHGILICPVMNCTYAIKVQSLEIALVLIESIASVEILARCRERSRVRHDKDAYIEKLGI